MLHRDALINRFLKYVSFDTQSDEENDAVCPSTPGQLVLSKALADELNGLGLTDVSIDDHGYVMATLPANGVDGPVVGFISHVDTSPDASGKDIKVVRKDNYDGKDIVLNEEKNIVFSTEAFPEILKYKGQDILFTDGTTLLGADDKAGVTAIVSAVEYLIQHPEIKHGKIRVGFTPDEETGRSAALFDVEKFGAHFAYTVDGGELGGLEYENFNAANWTITFHGRSVHTGDAKGKMRNALTMASEWQQLLPAGEKPEYTEGHEGFFHVYKVNGDVETCTMHLLIRDHDRKLFEEKKELLRTLVDKMNEAHPGCAHLELRDQYYNMREIVEPQKHIVDLAFEAMTSVGVEPIVKPIRGGTDGARLSFMGLPCPNIFAGGLNFHGRYEFLPVRSLEKSMETVIKIIELSARKS